MRTVRKCVRTAHAHWLRRRGGSEWTPDDRGSVGIAHAHGREACPHCACARREGASALRMRTGFVGGEARKGLQTIGGPSALRMRMVGRRARTAHAHGGKARRHCACALASSAERREMDPRRSGVRRHCACAQGGSSGRPPTHPKRWSVRRHRACAQGRIFPWLGLTYYRPKEMNGKLVRKGHEEPRILPLDPTSLTPKLDGELVTGNGSLSS
ncbi:uncharacterized protein [Dipodomys merriami]|uniref:uncharacterized protein isoform X2 n=1 Tax=Dipodomys merriami TaxID=94247 RepID=UPI003855DE54